jgi:hypothetical protein
MNCLAGFMLALGGALLCATAVAGQPDDTVPAGHVPVAYVARRGWHIDIGFAIADLSPPLKSMAKDFPDAQYVFFGFGDMHYLVAKHHGGPAMAAALWPGRGIILVTTLKQAPALAFDADQLVVLKLNQAESLDLQDFIWKSLVSSDGAVTLYQPGPYDGGFYYLAVPKYSALHTCNTWVAESLRSAGFKVHSTAGGFAGQLWSQAQRLEREQHLPPSYSPGASLPSH